MTAILSDVGNPIGREPGVGDTTAVDNGQEAPPDNGVTDIDGPGRQGRPGRRCRGDGARDADHPDRPARDRGRRHRGGSGRGRAAASISVGGYVSSSEEAGRRRRDRDRRRSGSRQIAGMTPCRGPRASRPTRPPPQVQTQASPARSSTSAARIANLRTTEAALQAIMAQATKIPRRPRGPGQADRGPRRDRAARRREGSPRGAGAYGTLAVDVRPAGPAGRRGGHEAGWDPAADADAATGTLIWIGQRVASFGIWVAIVGLPILLVIGVVRSPSPVLALARRSPATAPSPDPS